MIMGIYVKYYLLSIPVRSYLGKVIGLHARVAHMRLQILKKGSM